MKFQSSISRLGIVLVLIWPLFFTACSEVDRENVKIEGMTGPNVELANGYLLLSMVFNELSSAGGATIPVPSYPNSSIQIGPDFQSSGTLLVLAISAEDFLKDRGSTFYPLQKLPGGRSIPSVESGVLPAVAIAIPQLSDCVLYVGSHLIGFFVPYELNITGSMLMFRFHDKKKNPVGVMSLVGSDSEGENSGVLALVRADLLGLLPKPSRSTLRNLSRRF